MTNQATPVQTGGEAQPIADANSIDNIVDKAIIDSNSATPEIPEAEPAEPNEPADNAKDDAFPKKAVNAISRRDKQIGKWKAQAEMLAAENEKLRKQSQPATKTPSNGEPKEADFSNYAEYMEARSAWKIDQKFAEHSGKQQQTHQASQEQAWVSQREQAVAQTAQAFIKENPDAQALIEEHADIVDEYSPQLQRLFLEADNAPLAFYNLAKEGKLEDLANMSLAKAAMEIGRAQTQAPTKPKTKAPTPLPASRGSVASGKRVEDMNGSEIRSWLKSE